VSDEKNKATLYRVATELDTSIHRTLRPLLAEPHSDDETLLILRGAHQALSHHVGLLEALMAEILDRHAHPHDLIIAEREEGIQSGKDHGAHHVAGSCERCAN